MGQNSSSSPDNVKRKRESSDDRLASKYAKKLQIVLVNETVDTVHLDIVWNVFFGAPKDRIPIPETIKFIRYFCRASLVVPDRILEMEKLPEEMDTQKTGFLTYFQYKALFALVSTGCGLTMTASLQKTTRPEGLESYSDVELNVYDLHDLGTVNNYTLHLGFGAFHAGVAVYGTEISFAYPRGVYQVKPRQSRIGRFRTNYLMGRTSCSAQEVFEIIVSLKKRFRGSEYKIAENNCHHFCDELCHRLVHRSIPPSIIKISKIASHFTSFLPDDMEGRFGSLNDPEPKNNEDPKVRKMASLIVDHLKPTLHLIGYSYVQNDTENCQKFLLRFQQHLSTIVSYCTDAGLKIELNGAKISKEISVILNQPSSEENVKALNALLCELFESIKIIALRYEETQSQQHQQQQDKKQTQQQDNKQQDRQTDTSESSNQDKKAPPARIEVDEKTNKQ